NYLKDDMLKFGIYAQDQHVVVDAQAAAAHDALVKWLEDPNTEKVVYDAKKTYVVAHRLDIQIEGIRFDAMLASYIIDPSRSIGDVKSVVE
ncbi:DNA polymerase I, partial [Staphylococcus aureus]